MPEAFDRFGLHAALLKGPGKLRLQLGAYNLQHSEAAQQIDRYVAFSLSSVEGGHVQIEQCPPEGNGIDDLGHLRSTRQPDSRERARARRQIVHQGLDLAMTGDEAKDVIASALHKTSTQRDIVSEVVHSAHKIFQLKDRQIGRELRVLRMLSESPAALEEAESHFGTPGFGRS